MNETAVKVRPKNIPDLANSASMQRILASAAEKSRRYREKQRILGGMISVTKLLAA